MKFTLILILSLFSLSVIDAQNVSGFIRLNYFDAYNITTNNNTNQSDYNNYMIIVTYNSSDKFNLSKAVAAKYYNKSMNNDTLNVQQQDLFVVRALNISNSTIKNQFDIYLVNQLQINDAIKISSQNNTVLNVQKMGGFDTVTNITFNNTQIKVTISLDRLLNTSNTNNKLRISMNKATLINYVSFQSRQIQQSMSFDQLTFQYGNMTNNLKVLNESLIQQKCGIQETYILKNQTLVYPCISIDYVNSAKKMSQIPTIYYCANNLNMSSSNFTSNSTSSLTDFQNKSNTLDVYQLFSNNVQIQFGNLTDCSSQANLMTVQSLLILSIFIIITLFN